MPTSAATCSGNTTCGPNYSTPNQQYTYGTTTNRNWATSAAVWQAGSNASVNTILGTTVAPFPATNQAATPAIITNASPSNNLGSAVIDGLLIQHMQKNNDYWSVTEFLNMKKIIASILLFTANLSHAELQALDNQTLQSIQGQGGADLSLNLSLNHNILTDDLLCWNNTNI